MNIASLIDGLPIQIIRGSAETAMTGVVEDSREVTPGCLFVARRGAVHDGRRYIADAIAKGAAAVLTDSPDAMPPHVAALQCDDIARMTSLLAERFWGEPAKSLALIGVTGTNGKTTTVHLIHHILNHAGNKCGMVGTVQIDDGASITQPSFTTPPAATISPLLRKMVDRGCRACAMEVSSHALEQHRTAALTFDAAIFTNLSGDHLDYHRSMEDYLAAKAKLFASLKKDGVAVVNIDDPASDAIIEAATGAGARIITCSMADDAGDCSARIIKETITATEVSLAGPWGQACFQLPLCGRHNVMNALQAAAAAGAMGLSDDEIIHALIACTAPPGRLEPVSKLGDPFAVYVDYAHTDDALENVLRTLRPLVPDGGRLRVVFGCGGDRDATKRPRMARVACRYGDEIIITSDNPRTEDPQAIVDAIFAGVPNDRLGAAVCAVDRREAIGEAISRCREHDVVLIAGKGHETYQIVGEKRLDFDDRAVAAEALARVRAHGTA